MRIPSNRLQSVLQFAKKELSSTYDEREIQSFFYLLCEYFLGMNRTSVILNPNTRLSESELLSFNFSIKDLKKEKPIQYIIGSTDFFDFNFLVDEHTLIPRPETEELVQWIIDKEKSAIPLYVLDIGTGSGCIAISLAKQLSNTKVTGIDISEEALQIAQLNNENLHASVSFDLIDILNPPQTFNAKFNIIVSNPPYVLESEKALMKKNVLQYEPNQALFVEDNDPLLFYRKILDFARERLLANGRIYFEINEKMNVELSALLNDYKYRDIEIKNDLFDRPRMVCATKKS